MLIFRILFARKKSSAPKRRFFVVAALVGFLMVAQPQPAHAQWIVADIGQYAKEAIQWAKEALFWIAQKAEWVTNHYLVTGAAEGNNIGQMAQITGMNIGFQSVDDSIGQLPGKQQTAQITVDNTLLTGSNLCHVQMEVSALDQVLKAKTAMLAAFAASFTEVGAGGDDPNAKAALLKGLCDSSLMDPSDTSAPNGGNLLKTIGCATPAYSQFVGKFKDINSVIGIPEMYMPSNTTRSASTGRLVLPKVTTSTPVSEVPAIAALYYCMVNHPHTATAVARASGANLTNVSELVDQMTQKANANTGSESCLEQVADRMAVGSKAGQANPALQLVYEAQATLCLHMFATGKLTSTENSNCQSNGMSWINAQEHLHCRTGSSAYVMFRLGQGATRDGMTDELNRGASECTQYNTEVTHSAAAFRESMQQLSNTLPITNTTQTAH